MAMAGGGKAPRPVLKMPWTTLQIIMMVIGLIGSIVMMGAVWLYWADLPAQIPTHFGFSGEPDSWGSKTSLIILSMVGVVLFVVMVIISRYPHTFNYPWPITETNAEAQYGLAASMMLAVATGIAWLFAYNSLQTIRIALGQAQGLGKGFLIVPLLVTIGPVVYFIAAMRRAR